MNLDFDYVIMGSGFGGSVSALRLTRKGYRVLVVEQGRRFREGDFPKTNWNLRKWLWLPELRFHGFFRIAIFRHVTVLAGTGVGGGSLVYANTLPVPDREFFHSGNWKGLADWESELTPFYTVAADMLGAAMNPAPGPCDLALEELSSRIGRRAEFGPTRVGVFFGDPDIRVPDPYFDGMGPDRQGCRFCGGCMVGCRFEAKNSLDMNYLYLAEKEGAEILARTRVIDVVPVDETGRDGYLVTVRTTGGIARRQIRTKSFIFAGGVLGTVSLMLRLKGKSLRRLSECLGSSVRTNNEALIGVLSRDKTKKFSEGLAIGSILKTDEHSHLEPVRYPSGSGFWRLLMAPMISGRTFLDRLLRIFADYLRNPSDNFKAVTTGSWADRASILLFMQSRDSMLRLRRGKGRMLSSVERGSAPSAFIPEAQYLATEYARIVDGKPLVLPTESLFGIPTTAHVLGGACIGAHPGQGVIDTRHRVFGYENLYVIDGSAISSNPGVNPSLTITAMAERALSFIPEKKGGDPL